MSDASSLRTRLAAAGVPGPVVEAAIFPDWWGEECEADPALMPELEITTARLLGCSIDVVRDPLAALPPYVATEALMRIRPILVVEDWMAMDDLTNHRGTIGDFRDAIRKLEEAWTALPPEVRREWHGSQIVMVALPERKRA